MRHSCFRNLGIAIATLAMAQDRASALCYGSEPVLGLELGMGGAKSAVSLPDGSFQGLTTVNGSEGYIKLMETWYNLAVDSDASPTAASMAMERSYPIATLEHTQAIQRDWEIVLAGSSLPWLEKVRYALGWKRRDLETLYALDYYQHDESTAILAQTLAELQMQTFAALRTANPATVLPSRPYAEITLPSWIFAQLPLFQDDEDAELATQAYIGTSHLSTLTDRISAAVHRAGFRRTVENDPLLIMSAHTKGVRIGGPPPAPGMAINQALLGVCGGHTSKAKACLAKACLARRQALAPFTAAALLKDSAGAHEFVGLWLQSVNGGFDNAAGRHWKLDRGRSPARLSEVFGEVAQTILNGGNGAHRNVTSSGIPPKSATSQHTRLITGPDSSPALTSLLEVALTDHGVQYLLAEDGFSGVSAAIGAAEEARITYRSLAVSGIVRDTEL